MQNRRKTIVINKKFQYQYSMLIAALTVLSVNIFLIVKMLFPGNSPLLMSTPIMTGIALLELLLVGGIWYASIKASFRIAGPVYVFSREIKRLCEGDLTVQIRLREKDMFTEEAGQMNESFRTLRGRLSAIKEMAEKINTAHASGGEIGPLLQDLSGALSEITTDEKEQ